MTVPDPLRIYHIVHVDRLASIVHDGHLWCDARIVNGGRPGTTIGMGDLKRRRLGLPLSCTPGLMVGSCVPFYFCPRSVMLYLIYRANHENLAYRGGQGPIVHLECDFHRSLAWARQNGLRWAFTLSNAASSYFEDRNRIDALHEISWDAVNARQWSGKQEKKQAECLIEDRYPWHLVERIGVHSLQQVHAASGAIAGANHRPPIEIMREWYYP